MQTRFLYLFSFFLLATCYDYDYLLLVIENAGTVCESKTCSNPNKGTETGGVLNMHGLWPKLSLIKSHFYFVLVILMEAGRSLVGSLRR